MSELREKVSGEIPVRVLDDGQGFVSTYDIAEAAIAAAEGVGFKGEEALEVAIGCQEALMEAIGRQGLAVLDSETGRVYVSVAEKSNGGH
jgi:hypothetical protein